MRDTGPRLLAAADLARLRRDYRRLLPVPASTEEHLRGVLEDVLDHPGSLIRAQVAYGLLRRHPTVSATARPIAIALEYFHSASLILDDLPSMDNATERRGRPCPHRVHGEAAAILGALALVNQAYALLWRAFGEPGVSRADEAAALVSDCLSLGGVLDGQARDLHFRGGAGDAGAILDVAEGKTVALIELTFVLPALVGGAGPAVMAHLRTLARAWGLAYQVIDDFRDVLMRTGETGKTSAVDRSRGRPNLALGVGPRAALEYLTVLLGQGHAVLEALRAEPGEWDVLERLSALLDAQREVIEARVRVAACA